MHYNSAADSANDLVTELTKFPGIRAHAFQADLSDYDNVRTLHADVVAKLGNPDILFNNAGITGTVVGRRGNIEDVTLEDFENTWKVNTGSSFLVGPIICISAHWFEPRQKIGFAAHTIVCPPHGRPEIRPSRLLFQVRRTH